VPDIHDEVVLAQVRALAPDLGLIYGSPILKPALFEIPAYGTLGIHHGQVPQYRGKKTTFWAMYHGEPVAGVTIQKVTAGLDTGQIVRSGEVPIGRRSYGAVWRDVLALGLDLYIEAILQVREGTAVYRPQTGPKGKLYRDPKPADILRFWLASRFELGTLGDSLRTTVERGTKKLSAFRRETHATPPRNSRVIVFLGNRFLDNQDMKLTCSYRHTGLQRGKNHCRRH
jgi:hypothetical protein